MSLQDIVSVSISVSGASPSVEAFDIPLICAYHSHWTDLTRVYTSLSGMTSDGFTTSEPAYLMAQALKASNPSIARWKIGRRALAFTQVVRLTPEAPTTGKVYAVDIAGLTATYTALGGDTTVAQICTALSTVVNALSGAPVTATGASTTYVQCTSAAGVIKSYANMSSTLTLLDASADPGIATDLAAIYLADKNWYGLLLDNQSKAEVVAAAAWAESNTKLFGIHSMDSLVLAATGSDTTSSFHGLQASSYKQTYGIYHQSIGLYWPAATWMGERFPSDPGSDTWAFKTLAGVPVSPLTDSQVTNLLAKNANAYITVAGINMTYADSTGGAKCFSGQYIDITRGINALVSSMQTDLFGLIASQPDKLPLTDAGIDMVVATLRAVLRRFARRGFLNDSTIVVTAPKAADISSTDRGNRKLPLVAFSANLQGAIHAVQIQGVVTQ